MKTRMTDSFSNLDRWFDDDKDMLNHLPSDGGWSGVQILEHVMLTNHYLLLLIDKATIKSMKRAAISKVELDWRQYVLNSDSFNQIGKNKSFVWIRPEHMEPTGNITMSVNRMRLFEQRDQCILNLDKLKNGEGVLSLTTMSVNSLGKLDVYQYIYFLALHIDRHLEQLNRNRSEFFKTGLLQ